MGGPRAGELVADRGLYWRVIARVAMPPDPDEPGGWQLALEAPAPTVGQGEAGTYVKRGGAYHWEADDVG